MPKLKINPQWYNKQVRGPVIRYTLGPIVIEVKNKYDFENELYYRLKTSCFEFNGRLYSLQEEHLHTKPTGSRHDLCAYFKADKEIIEHILRDNSVMISIEEYYYPKGL